MSMQATTGGATLNNIWHPQFSVAGTILGHTIRVLENVIDAKKRSS